MNWLQFHLSTLLLLMFASGLLIWGNVTPKSRTAVGTFDTTSDVITINGRQGRYLACNMEFKHGWPMTFNSIAVAIEPRFVYFWNAYVSSEELDTFPRSENERKIFNSGNSFKGEWHYFPLAVNVATGLAILLALGCLIEWRNRKTQVTTFRASSTPV